MGKYMYSHRRFDLICIYNVSYDMYTKYHTGMCQIKIPMSERHLACKLYKYTCTSVMLDQLIIVSCGCSSAAGSSVHECQQSCCSTNVYMMMSGGPALFHTIIPDYSGINVHALDHRRTEYLYSMFFAKVRNGRRVFRTSKYKLLYLHARPPMHLYIRTAARVHTMRRYPRYYRV